MKDGNFVLVLLMPSNGQRFGEPIQTDNAAVAAAVPSECWTYGEKGEGRVLVFK